MFTTIQKEENALRLFVFWKKDYKTRTQTFSRGNGTTLLRYASPVTEQKKCWDLLRQKFDWFQTIYTQQVPTLLWFHANGRNMLRPFE